tara:strand:+ start:2532 stop:3596 length:1065 start_codon:yes stop_codon:yes gene_type:complete
MKIKINKTYIAENLPTYFIADIGANHDGSLKRAKKLIKLCSKAGANAAKFQHFKAETIVSNLGFKSLKIKTHQSNWKKDVFDVYKKASIDLKWTNELKKTCKKYKIDFFTSPYDLDYVDKLNKYICAFKIGSGDITWTEIIKKISKKNKPVILATGASGINDVDRAIKVIKKHNKKIILMQCNTNYTGDNSNLNYINLNVLDTYKKRYGNSIILGLSDHTFGNLSVLGAVAKGARVIEKHFTDNNNRKGPDHHFAMNPKTWKKMVKATRDLELMIGDGIKRVEKNEINAKIVQQRSVRAKIDILKGKIIKKTDLICLRPKSKTGLQPYKISKILGKKAIKTISKSEEINWKKIK